MTEPDQSGLKERLADVMVDAASELDGRLVYTAEYIRTRDVRDMRDDFVAQVRKRPLLSVGIAIGAGYLIGRAMGMGGSSYNRKGRKHNALASQIGAAVVSSVGTLVAAQLRDRLTPPRRYDEE